MMRRAIETETKRDGDKERQLRWNGDERKDEYGGDSRALASRRWMRDTVEREKEDTLRARMKEGGRCSLRRSRRMRMAQEHCYAPTRTNRRTDNSKRCSGYSAK